MPRAHDVTLCCLLLTSMVAAQVCGDCDSSGEGDVVDALRVAQDSVEPAKLIMLTYEPKKRGNKRVETVAIVGNGLMGQGIAQVFARSGRNVVLIGRDPAITSRLRIHAGLCSTSMFVSF